MPVTVRDLEVAQVLAREVKAAAARSAGASLRADQVRLLFGAADLDRAERERIQAALEMVGLDPQPSLLEVDGDAPIAFVARPPGSFPPQRRRRFGGGEAHHEPPAEPARAPTERGEFPTVGEFARSTFERARRRLAERDDAAPPAETNGAPAPAPAAEADHLDFDYVPPPAGYVNGSREASTLEPAVAEPEPDSSEPASDSPEPEAPVAGTEGDAAAVPEHASGEETATPDESPAGVAEESDFAAGEESPPVEAEPDLEDLPAADAEETAVEEPPASAEPDPMGDVELEEPAPSVDAPIAGVPPPMTAARPAQRAEIAAVIAAAALLPVIGTSIAGWHFGLPYLALAVAATGWLVAKDRAEGGSGGGVVAAVRSSPLAHGAMRATALLTIVSVVAAVLLASASTSHPAAARATPAALGDWMRPVTANARRIRATAHRRRRAHRAVKHHVTPPVPTTTAPAPTPTVPAAPAPSTSQAPPSSGGGTQGLYEVPAGK
jgi:hypothetical protein